MRRRAVVSGLVTGVAAALAGCAGGSGNGGDSCTAGTAVRFEPVDSTDIAAAETPETDEMREMGADLLDRTLEGDEPTVETLRGTPLGWLTYVERNGAFYEIEEETVETGRVSGPEYELSRDRETPDDVSSSDAVSFADLPRHDRWRINEAADFNVENVDGIRFSVTFVAGYLDPEDETASRLAAGVDDPFLAVDGSYAELERTGDGEASASRVRYAAERIADTVDGFADHVLERRGTKLEEPSEAVRSLIEDAVANDGRLGVCDHERDEIDEETAAERRTAVDRLESRVGDPHQYVEYEGTWYRVELSSYAL